MTNFPYYMICIWTFIHIGRPQDIFTFLMPLHIGDITAGLTIMSYYLTGQHGPQIRSYPEARLFLIFLGLAVLCIPLGYYPRKGVEFLLGFGIKLGIYLWLVAKLVTTEERIEGILKTLMFSGFAMAISAILRSGIGGRIGGGGAYDPNDLALVLVTTLPIAVMLGLSSSKKYWKIICFGGGALNLLGIIATRSRGGFLGLIALGVFMFFVKLPGISKKRLILLLSILAIVFGTYVGTEYKERISTIFEESTADLRSGSGRILVWRRTLLIAKDNPVLGVGPDAFRTAYGDYLKKDKFRAELSPDEAGWAPHKWSSVHNSFLLVLAEMGIPGLLIFMAINIRSFRNFNRVKALSLERDSTDVSGIQATSLQMALVGFLVCAFFLSQSYNGIIYLSCFLSGAMVRNITAEKSAKK